MELSFHLRTRQDTEKEAASSWHEPYQGIITTTIPRV